MVNGIKIRNEYSIHGVDGFYKIHGNDYSNPHENVIKELIKKAEEKHYIGKKVLDLCCGSGEITSLLMDTHFVIGVDPYTSISYYNRIGKLPLVLDFKDIANGKLEERFDTIICSFALHLCPKSLLPMVLWNLSNISNKLIVISPNKNPDCNNIYGWSLVEEIIQNKVRMKLYEIKDTN